MKLYVKTFELRWSDVDANLHVMHSKYYELGAHCRMGFLLEHGITLAVMQECRVSPILFRECCVFRRELVAGEVVTVNLLLTKCRADASRWSVRHEILKAGGLMAAVIDADLAWLHLDDRKLATPPPAVIALLDQLPRSDDFVMEAGA